MRIDNCTALVTGASAGIGREFARLLAPRVKTFVIVARRQERLEELAGELNRINPNLAVYPRSLDLNSSAEVSALPPWLREKNISVDVLINNAGLGDMGAFATSDPERILRMLNVNISALTQLTRALLPDMKARKSGGILNVSSSAGFLPIPGFAVYAATKAYVNSFSEALRGELARSGISVCALCPGPVHTEFTEVARRADEPSQPSGPEFLYVPVAEVAAAGLRGLESGQAIVIPGTVMKIGMFITRLIPMAVHRLFSEVAARRRGLDLSRDYSVRPSPSGPPRDH
jgi:hypothetical protein